MQQQNNIAAMNNRIGIQLILRKWKILIIYRAAIRLSAYVASHSCTFSPKVSKDGKSESIYCSGLSDLYSAAQECDATGALCMSLRRAQKKSHRKYLSQEKRFKTQLLIDKVH